MTALLLALLLQGHPPADDEADLAAARAAALKTFKDQVAPFLTTYCSRCHGEKRQKGGVRFDYALKTPAVPSFRLLWNKAAAHLHGRDMPPADEKQPVEDERKMFLAWIAGVKVLSPKDPGEFVIHRLTKVELGNTLRDLFGVDPSIVGDLPDEVPGAGYTNSVSPLLLERVLLIANEVVAKLPRDYLQGDAREAARLLARRAYRRPPTEAEIDVLNRVYALAKSPSEGMRLLMKAVLVSPQFLFITPGLPPEAHPPGAKEGGETPAADVVRLDDHQLASRLSYLLWSTMPDAELSALADKGSLHEPEVLAAQARRMIADPRSRALFDGFGAQWLGLDKLAGKTFDAAKFPQMTPALRAAMVDEARLFFESILRENKSLATFVEADYGFVNETLAPIYGLDGIQGPAMRRVALTDANRGGVLGMAGMLATTSFPNRTGPVNRGVWVLEQILGEHVPPPPANVPTLENQDPKQVGSLTLRQRTELHRTNPTCASCHKVLDPIGFGLENFDAIGRWRDRDENGGAIDASGVLPGNVRFGSPKELKRILAGRRDDVARNLTSRLLAYALGRGLDGYDEIVVDRMTASVAKDGYKMGTLVVEVVGSYPFTHRRIRDLKGPSNAK